MKFSIMNKPIFSIRIFQARVRSNGLYNVQKRFYHETQLTIHQRIYTGEKPSVCRNCGRPSVRNHILSCIRGSRLGRNPVNAQSARVLLEVILQYSSDSTSGEKLRVFVVSKNLLTESTPHYPSVSSQQRKALCMW